MDRFDDRRGDRRSGRRDRRQDDTGRGGGGGAPLGLVVKLIGGGIGLAQEVRSERATKQQQHPATTSTYRESPSPSTSRSSVSPSSSKHAEAIAAAATQHRMTDPPPPYTEDYVEMHPKHAHDLISMGKAQPVGAVVRHQSMFKGRLGDSDSSAGEDEHHWELDEMIAHSRQSSPGTQTAPGSGQTPKGRRGIDGQITLDSYAARVMATCPPPPFYSPRLELPVILPQRRPGEKGRGFIRAYAPVLSASGISQETFLSFIKNFHAASSATPILNVVFIGAGIAGFVPEPFTTLGSMAVQAAAGAAMELQSRKRTNDFLDRMNDALFKPRGLYAMVMSFLPQATRQFEARSVDIDGLVASQSGNRSDWRTGFQPSSGTTHGELELPPSAPLVFPALDEAINSSDSPAQPKNIKTSKILAGYMDKRAQALYAAKHPGSGLNVPEAAQPRFASRFADPNDLGGNTNIITLVTGGKVDLGRRDREERRQREMQQEAQREQERASGQSGGLLKGLRSMKKSILYLMIVNMPTEDELRRARATVAEAQRQHY